MAEMMRPKRKERVEEGAPPWMVTYGDLVTQMLVFFVMLFTFSTLDPVKIIVSSRAIREAVGGSPGGGQPRPDDAIQDIIKSVDTTDFKLLAEGGTIVKTFADGTEVRMDNQAIRRYVITLGGQIAFQEGSAALSESEETKRIIESILLRTVGMKNIIELCGFTSANPEDSVPGSDGQPNHWNLGFARANAVAEKLLAAGFDFRRLRISTGGMTEPVETNADLELRHKNRRVEVAITDRFMVE